MNILIIVIFAFIAMTFLFLFVRHHKKHIEGSLFKSKQSYAINGGTHNVKHNVACSQQVGVLTNHILRLTPLDKFVWTEKTDGERAEIEINNNDIKEIATNKSVGKFEKSVSQTLLNAELLNNKYYVFDACMIDGEDVTNLPFMERYEKIRNLIKGSRIFIPKEYYPVEDTNLVTKFIDYTESPNTGNKVDGVIFQRKDLPYNTMSAFKYKRPVLNTIDFYIKYVPEKGSFLLYLWGSYKNMIYNLQRLPKINKHSKKHTGVDSDSKKYPNKFLILFSSPLLPKSHEFVLQPHWNKTGYKRDDIFAINELMNKIINKPIDYDGKIVEMSYSTNGWVPYRTREEKKFPNGYDVGLSNCEIIFSPVDFNYNRYFEVNIQNNDLNDLFHKVNKKVRALVISYILSKFPSNNVLDLAGGRGGDAEYLVKNGIISIFAVDADKEAIIAYNNRLKKMNNNKISFNGFGFELSEDNTELILDVKHRFEYNNGFSLALMNYAIHYICNSSGKLRELNRTLSHLLKPDGYFVFSYFDGEQIMTKASDNVLKLSSYTITIHPDSYTVSMPLPTIDKTGYRDEPLVTREILSALDIDIIEEFYPVKKWYDELKIIDPSEEILDLTSLIRIVICKPVKRIQSD